MFSVLKDLIIVGASGLGREVAWIVERINEKKEEWNVVGFLDDNPDLKGTLVNGYQVLGGVSDVDKYSEAWYICAIGFANVREKVIRKIGDVKFATLIDPSVLHSDTVEVGEGTVIGPYSIIGVNAHVGKHVLIRVNDMIGHDSVISDFVTIYPSVNVSGADEIGECTELGVGSKIIQGKKIGKNSVIGAGAVVIKDIPDCCTAVGTPAKPIKFHDEKEPV